MPIRIRKRRNRASTTYQVDAGIRNGRRYQRSFATKAMAEQHAADLREKLAEHGESALLSDPERLRFQAARERLATVGATIEEAVEFLLQHRRPLREPITLEDLQKRCTDDKERLGMRPHYVAQFKCSCKSFVEGRELRHAHTVTREDVQAWISGNGWKPKTQRVYLGDLRTLFAWAVQERYVSANPISTTGPNAIRLAEPEESEIGTLSVEAVKALLDTAAAVPEREAEDFRGLLWYVVLGTFAGIRPDELQRMSRDAVLLEDRHVVVAGAHAKTRRRRIVDLTENAVAWLLLDRQREGPVCPKNFVRRWERLRTVAKVGTWPHDGLRHTFASMHYALWQNESLLKAQLGHAGREDVLFSHYRALKTRREAAEFWALRPDQEKTSLP
jgi:integrase